MVPAVLAHNPSHHVGVRSHVGCGNIFVGPNEIVNLVHEGARDVFQFTQTALTRIDGDSALGTSVRNIHDGGFPRHQRRQRAHFIQVDFGVISQTTFKRTSRNCRAARDIQSRFVMNRHPFDGHLNLDFSLGRKQQTAKAFIQLQTIRSLREELLCGFRGIHHVSVFA